MFCLKFYINVGEIIPGGSLAPVLAPFGFDLGSLSKELNLKSQQFFVKGAPIPLKLLVINNKNYIIKFGNLNLKFFVNVLIDKQLNILNILDCYNLILLYCRDYNLNINQSSKLFLSSLFSFSKKIKIKI